MLALGIDTSTSRGSVGLADDDGPIEQVELNSTSNHVERLLPAIETLLSGAGRDTGGLDFIAVATGPGSFTGVRIAMATGKGLALAAGRPLAGFSTLETMALAAARANPRMATMPVCVVLRAGRGEVYRGLFDCANGRATSLLPEAALSPVDAIRDLPDRCGLTGDGMELCCDQAAPRTRDGWILEPVTPLIGAALALRAIDAARRAGFAGFPALVPNYLRLSDAEVQSNRS